MADILIRGMEMPKDGHVIVRIYANGDVCEPTPCPGVWGKVARVTPLPDGHGRLGDLDALMNNIGDVPYKGAVRRVLMSAPTIVQAEGGVEECSEN